MSAKRQNTVFGPQTKADGCIYQRMKWVILERVVQMCNYNSPHITTVSTIYAIMTDYTTDE